MQIYISILRGINVGGNRILKMEALRALYAELGFRNVQTYIQSGNVIFQYDQATSGELGIKIASAIAEKFALDVPVIVIELEELRQIIADNPFSKETSKDIRYLHVTVLSETPDKEKYDKIGETAYLPDEFQRCGKAIYLYCPAGYGNTKLTNSFFEGKLNVTATTRNWKTANELLRLAEEMIKL